MAEPASKKSVSTRELIAAVGLLGIIIALASVAMEIRHNTHAVRSATLQAIAAQAATGTVLALDYPELRRALRTEAGGAPLSDDQHHMLVVYYQALLRIRLNQFVQARSANIDSSELLRIGGQTEPYRTRFFQELWDHTASQYPDDFQEFVNRELVSHAARPDTPNSGQ